MEYILANKEWIFSGIGISIIGIIALAVKKLFNNKDKEDGQVKVVINNENNVSTKPILNEKEQEKNKTLDDYKDKTRILFIDDAKFNVVTILKNDGWVHTHRIKDCKSLTMSEIKEADILFIDIQGVGKALEFKDEGLGLAEAIKERYSSKIVVIYSAENNGDRFHKALRKVDDFLSKDAEPYEFMQLIEMYTLGKK